MKINFKDTKEKINKFVESKGFRNIIYVLGAIFILVFVFQAGMIAGFKKASFGKSWGDNYERNFGRDDRKDLFMRNMQGMPNPHGAVGKIIKIELPNIVVLDKDQIEKVVVVSDSTNIFERKEKLSKENLTLDKFVVVIGDPNSSGQIEAKLIRVMPAPEEMMKGDVSRMKGLPFDDNRQFN